MHTPPAPPFAFRAAAALVFITLAATCSCSSGGGTGAGGASSTGSGGVAVEPPSCPPTPATGDFPCGVGAVIAAKCQPCHQMPTLHGAHFPLLTYEDTQQPFGLTTADGGPPFLRWMRMYQVIQPGFLPHMPSNVYPACDGGLCQLDDAELQTLDGWLEACVPTQPEGTGCDVGEGPADAGADH